MTDIEKKAYEAYPINNSLNTYFGNEKIDYNAERREGYIKCVKEYESLPKISGWVARDIDGHLQLFTGGKPHQEHNLFWDNSGKRGNYVLSLCNIENEVFPEITWESEPRKVELLINIV